MPAGVPASAGAADAAWYRGLCTVLLRVNRYRPILHSPSPRARMHCVKTAVRVAVTPSRHSGSITAYMISYRYGRPQRGEGLNVQVVYNKKNVCPLCGGYNYDST